MITSKSLAATSVIILALLPIFSQAQDDLMKELEAQDKNATQYIGQTFKGSRLVNGQSVETKGKGELEIIFSHRFGTINSGFYNYFGLDEAVMRMGFEYGITDRLGVSVGRSSNDKTFDGYLKYKVARQRKGSRNFPFTITAVGTGMIKSSPKASDNPDVLFVDRLAYVGEVLIARKFTPAFSAQVTPIFVHRNSISGSIENNDDIAIGMGGRYKITKSMAITAEYFYRLDPHENTPYYNSIGFGIDIETGGHVFQMVFTNSLGMIDRTVVAETAGNFSDGDIHFGFNITRAFYPGKKK